MAVSRYQIYVALTVFAAMSVQIGCGNDRKRPVSVNRGLRPVGANNNKGQLGAGAQTGLQGAAAKAGATGSPDPKSPTMTKDISRVEQSETAMKAGTEIQLSTLAEGTYTLTDVSSSYRYMKSTANESFIAVHGSKVAGDVNTGYSLPETAGDSAGIMATEGDNGREIDLPILFTVEKVQGIWIPRREQTSKITLFNQVINNKLTENFRAAGGEIKASVMGVLAQGGALTATDEKGALITLKLLSVDAKTLTIWMSIDEVTPSKSATDTGLAVARNIFLKYNIAAKPAEQQQQTAAPADSAASQEAAAAAPPADANNPADLPIEVKNFTGGG